MREKLLEILTEAVPGVDFETETALVDDEIFDVEITVDDLVPENFNSLDAMLALLQARKD